MQNLSPALELCCCCFFTVFLCFFNCRWVFFCCMLFIFHRGSPLAVFVPVSRPWKSSLWCPQSHSMRLALFSVQLAVSRPHLAHPLSLFRIYDHTAFGILSAWFLQLIAPMSLSSHCSRRRSRSTCWMALHNHVAMSLTLHSRYPTPHKKMMYVKHATAHSIVYVSMARCRSKTLLDNTCSSSKAFSIIPKQWQ